MDYREGYWNRILKGPDIAIKNQGSGDHMVDKERRQHRRDHVNIPAELFVQDQAYPCRIKDISVGGFFVEIELFFPIGEKLLLTAKDIPMVEKAGRTVRIDLSGIGGMFEEKEDTLERTVNQKEK
jgi:hypothetical protein